MLRLRPPGVACPELVEGLSTNGKRTTASRAVRPERSVAKSKGNRSISYPYFKKDSYSWKLTAEECGDALPELRICKSRGNEFLWQVCQPAQCVLLPVRVC